MKLYALKEFMRSKPILYDLTTRLKRTLGISTPAYRFLDRFSRAIGRRVRFVQIGANDGLRKDPIREFIVRDRWTGVLVEPLPHIFEQLKANYRHIPDGLVFVNAAVSTSSETSVSFWTFDEKFMKGWPSEKRLEYLRKSSFSREHLLKYLERGVDPATALLEMSVPSLTVAELVLSHFPDGAFDLLVIDVEGFEPRIIRSIDFEKVSPQAIFFESHHLGKEKEATFDFLRLKGYSVTEVAGDAVATRDHAVKNGENDPTGA